MRNKHQDCLSSNTLTEYPNDRILILNSVGTVDSEQPVKVKILLFLFILVFSSCKYENKKQEALNTFFIEDFQNKVLGVDELASGMKLLPLKLGTDQLIGKIKDVCFIGDTIYLLDEMTASIYSFDMKDGKCIGRICKKGNGPNEYVNPVALSADSGKLYVLDMPTSRIIEFDKSLNPIRDLKFNFPSSDFIAINTGFLLYNLAPNSELNKYVYLYNKGDCITSFVPANKNHSPNNNSFGNLGKPFVKDENDKVFVSESYSNIIYKWEKENFIPIYRIDFGKLNVPLNVNKNRTDLFEEPYAFHSNSFVFSEILVPSFFYKSHRYYGFIPKSGDSPKFGIVKDRQYDIPFFPQWQNGNQLIAISRYEAVKNYFEDYKQVKEDSIAECFEPEHPVLVIYNLKSI